MNLIEQSETQSVAALALELKRARNKVANLEIALQSSRAIGIAIGVIVERCKINSDQAFDLLVQISQSDQRKVRDVADELVLTGVIRN